MLRTYWKAAALAAFAFLPACNKTAPTTAGTKPKVAVVTNVTADFWKICEAGHQKAAKEFDVDLIFRMPAKLDAAAQKEVIDAVTKQGISGIAISVVNPKEQTANLKLIAKKMNFLTMDNDAPNSDRICYIGTGNYEAGVEAGKLVKEALPDGGTVVIAVGSMEPDNARGRFAGVVDTLAGMKGAKGPTLGKYELHTGTALTADGQEACFQQMKDTMKKLGDKQKLVFVGLYAYNPPAILQAAQELGMVDKIKIVGFDEDTVTLDGVSKGKIHGTIVQDPFNFGYKSVEVLAALARDDKSKIVKEPIPVKVVTKDGGPGKVKADDYSAELKRMLGK